MGRVRGMNVALLLSQKKSSITMPMTTIMIYLRLSGLKCIVPCLEIRSCNQERGANTLPLCFQPRRFDKLYISLPYPTEALFAYFARFT